MKINYILLFFSFLSFSALAQQSEVRQLASFTSIKASEGIDVYLKNGDKESARVEVSGIDLSNVLTEVAGSSLRIHLRDQHWSGRKSIKVYVTYVHLDKIAATSAANIFSEGVVHSTNLSLAMSSAASVEISLEAETVTVDASSAGNSVLEGKTKTLEVEASSAGDIDAYRLESEKVYARTSSAGSVKINVKNELEAHASSGGVIRYRGNPVRTNTDSSSGGSVKKTN